METVSEAKDAGVATGRTSRGKTPRPRYDSLEQEVYLQLWRSYDRLRAIEDALFRPFDLTPQQYNVLRLLEIAGADGLPTLEIARRLITRAPDISRILDKLETAGLIARRRRDDNRRLVEVRITVAGLDLLAKIAQPLRACHHKQLGHLSDAKLRQLASLLRAARRPHETAHGHWDH